ncbi:MAG: SsrA-binding protein SmpB [Flavobacteriales bacterium]|nr:SsrA-binding protein SmpB [Flavobacteriales bacterium]MBT6746703.1 SsrA-binding protein SmpB [Flavobacteriales bacterium]
MSDYVNIKNRKASFEYHLIDKFVAGLQLLGTEIKSIRESKASIAEGYCTFMGDELFVKNMHIAEYSHGGFVNHEPKRMRKLLLSRQELDKLLKKTKIKGFTIVPTRLFIGKNGYAKLEIALAEGKKLYDKRESLKQADDKRSMDRTMKNYR